MSNKKVIELARYKKFFNSSKEEFELLSKLSSDELGLMNDKVAKVTPLLKQIYSYALIVSFIDDNDIETLRTMSHNGKLFDEADDVRYACVDYFYDLEVNDCHNPTFEMYKAVNAGAILFDEIFDNIGVIVDEPSFPSDTVEENIKDSFINICRNVEKFYDGSLHELSSTIDLYKTSDLLLTSFSIIADRISKKYMMINDQNTVLNYDKDKQNLVLNASSLSAMLSYLYSYINMTNFSIDLQVMNYLNEAYTLFKSYQNNYFINNEKEKYLLKKCKKM